MYNHTKTCVRARIHIYLYTCTRTHMHTHTHACCLNKSHQTTPTSHVSILLVHHKKYSVHNMTNRRQDETIFVQECMISCDTIMTYHSHSSTNRVFLQTIDQIQMFILLVMLFKNLQIIRIRLRLPLITAEGARLSAVNQYA